MGIEGRVAAGRRFLVRGIQIDVSGVREDVEVGYVVELLDDGVGGLGRGKEKNDCQLKDVDGKSNQINVWKRLMQAALFKPQALCTIFLLTLHQHRVNNQ